MTPSRWQQIEAIYHAALERAPAERAAFLEQACSGDADLRREVESLLAQDSSRKNPLDRPAWEGQAGGSAVESTVTMFFAGMQLGPYKIEGPLGEGGMAVVYKALDTKLHRPVAVKLLSDRLADPAARRRFQREAQTASSLNHPHILAA
jgi:serine/threonine protein kinase